MAVTTCLLLVALLAALHITTAVWARTRTTGRLRYPLLCMHAVLALLPIPSYGTCWVGVDAESALPLRARWGPGLLPVGTSASAWTEAWWQIRSGSLALIMVAVTLLAAAVALLPEVIGRRTARRPWIQATIRSAEINERLRIARDLHDLLAGRLAAIALKGDLADRLLDTSEERTRAELADIIQLTRAALTEVRQLAQGYRDLDLADELTQAQSLLWRAGITVHTTAPTHLPLSCETATVLGAALREGVTNVLRHSDARVCEVRIERRDDVIALLLRNDRTEPVATADAASGNGLRNLAERVAAVGGRLRTDRSERGWFRLIVECPFGPRTASRAPELSAPHPDGSAPLSC